MTNMQDPLAQRPRRSTFLTVLCVLTFIGSGFQIPNQLASYTTAEEQVAHIERIVERYARLDDDALPEAMVLVAEQMLQSELDNLTVLRIKRFSLGMLISGLFTFFGAMGMWRLRKWGFHFYLAGILAYMAIPWVAFTGLKATAQGSAALMIGLLMVLLYSFNYRRLS